jgi:thymidylate kinase
MEKKDLPYHKRVRSGYLAIAKKEPERVKVIPVSGSIEDTQRFIRNEADIVVRKFKRTG